MHRKFWLCIFGLCGLYLVVQLVVFFHLPATIPLHWNTAGAIDRWGPRIWQLLFAVLPLVAAVLLWALPRFDPLRRSYARHRPAWHALTLANCLFLMAMGSITAVATLNHSIPIPSIVIVTVAALLIVTGNYLPQMRPNFFIGIRTPWTLADSEVWRRTHRIGGISFCVAGLLFLVFALPPLYHYSFVAITLLVLLSLIPCLYSYILYRKRHSQP